MRLYSRISESTDCRFQGTSDATTIVVDTSVLLQPILGFGGALTESSVSVFSKLTASAQERFLQAYYGDDGLKYTFARTHIGSCDFSLVPYFYQTEKDDFEMKTFNMSHDEALLIPFIQQVKKVVQSHPGRQFQLVSSPWTPPKWSLPPLL
jgi:glucosylceramidase